MNCRPDVLVCRDCIRWLASASGMLDVTPKFPVVDMDAAAKFYEAVGGRVRRYDDGFAFVTTATTAFVTCHSSTAST